MTAQQLLGQFQAQADGGGEVAFDPGNPGHVALLEQEFARARPVSSPAGSSESGSSGSPDSGSSGSPGAGAVSAMTPPPQPPPPRRGPHGTVLRQGHRPEPSIEDQLRTRPTVEELLQDGEAAAEVDDEYRNMVRGDARLTPGAEMTDELKQKARSIITHLQKKVRLTDDQAQEIERRIGEFQLWGSFDNAVRIMLGTKREIPRAPKGPISGRLGGFGKPKKGEGDTLHHPYIGNDPIFSHIPSFPEGEAGNAQRKEWAGANPQRNKRSEQAVQVLFLADEHGIDRGQLMITKNQGGISMRFDKVIPNGPTQGKPVLNKELISKAGLTAESKGCYGRSFDGMKRKRE